MAKPKPQRKPPAKTGKPAKSGEASAPAFDASRAIEAAATLVAGGKKTGASKPASRRESAEFKQLKEGVNQPHLQGLDKLLDTSGSASSKKSNLPFEHGGSKQVGHNQTFGADVNRSGVPRRTGG